MDNKWGIDLSYEHKTPCPRCRKNGRDTSGNNLHVYGENNGAYCWSCEFTIPSRVHREAMGWDDNEEEEEVSTREKITPEENTKIKSYTGNDCKGWRGIKKETNAFFGVRYEYDEETGEPVKMFVPTTINYELVGYKTRTFPKDFTNPIGIVGKDCDLVGEFRFKDHTRTCLIVGGETKVLCAYQMLNDDRLNRGKEDFESVAVVSPTVGENGCAKQIQARYSYFDRFQKIIICMDDDPTGQEANKKIAKVLPKGKVYIMKMRYKDADIYIEKNDEKSFIKDFWNAKPYTPDGIVASSELSSKIREAALMPKIPLPPFMHKLQKMMAGGIPLKVIINLASASGTGKSTIVDECLYYWIFNSPYRIGVVTLESDCGQWGTKILSRHVQRKIDLIEDTEEKMTFLDSPEVLEKERELFFKEDGTPRFHLIEERDGGIESLKELVNNLIIACDCQVIILDPLQDILDGISNEEQSVFMRWMKGMVKSHDVTFINVNHVRKSSGNQKANSTGAEMHEEDIMGSGSILKSGACNLLFTRNKEAEDEFEKNTTKMKASKIRWTGRTGVAGEYYYHNDTHTLWDKDDYLMTHPQEF